jgi:hypothetical protein
MKVLTGLYNCQSCGNGGTIYNLAHELSLVVDSSVARAKTAKAPLSGSDPQRIASQAG